MNLKSLLSKHLNAFYVQTPVFDVSHEVHTHSALKDHMS